MATTKSHTDLEQSKKLAEFLPIESADMCFNTFQHNSMPPLMTPYSRFDEFYDMGKTPDFLIPCWSLAALIDVLPETINFVDENDYKLEIEIEDGLYYLAYGNPLEHGKLEVEPKENYVDACYEMIIKLKELNLL